MREFHLHDLRREYADFVRQIAAYGDRVAPRGRKTREIRDVVITFDDARQATFPVGIGRGVSYDVLAAEAMQWLGGISDLRQLISVSSTFADFSDDDETLYGAYGPRAYTGLRRAVRILSDDSTSRQANVSIWRHDETQYTRDLPCTVAWTFLIRDDRLHMTTYMRSNDVWTGVAYDVPIMARIATAMAWALDVGVGGYTHHAASMHVYEDNLADVEQLHMPVDAEEPPFLDDIGNVFDTPIGRWGHAAEWAHVAALGANHLPPAFDWYASRLRDTDRNPYFCTECRYYLPEVGHDHGGVRET